MIMIKVRNVFGGKGDAYRLICLGYLDLLAQLTVTGELTQKDFEGKKNIFHHLPLARYGTFLASVVPRNTPL